MKDKDRKISLTDLPLNQFKVGQPLMVKFNINSGHDIHCDAEFLGIEKGLVKVKITDVNSPSWFSYTYDIPNRYPDFIGKFRAKSCYLWGQSGKISWPRCHWFTDTKTPVE